MISISPGKNYEFKCYGEIVTQKCGIIKGICEVNLNQKLEKYNLIFDKGEIRTLKSFKNTNAEVVNCSSKENSLQCQQLNNCKATSKSNSNKLLSVITENSQFKSNMNTCLEGTLPISGEKLNLLSQIACKQELEGEKILNLEDSILKQCPQVHLNDSVNVDCKINKLLKTLKYNPTSQSVINLFQRDVCNLKEVLLSESGLRDINTEFGKFLSDFFSNGMLDCNLMNLDQKNLDQLLCFKAEEFKFIKFKNDTLSQKECLADPVWEGTLSSVSTAADREKNVNTRKITGQPDKADFTLPTESPSIKNQETLQKIDKLIADNGGEVTPEIAKQAGAIFNSGIYQPTKNFINSVEKAISDRAGSSSSSGSSSSRYRGNKNDKAYEIGSKTSGARTVANITEEAPSAARAAAINGKISAAPGSSASTENDVVNSQSNNNKIATSNKQNDKLSSNNFSAGSSSAGGPQGSASVGGSAPNLASASSGARGEELPQLPSLSAADKSEITKVVQALKGAESSEDVKSIVTGEDNFAQVKSIIQELEQNKKNTVQNREINNARNPASVQSGEVKDFEKTLEKFGIKVYGEAGPGKAVYAPQKVNHVIVLKNNTVQFLNTIRSKK